MLTVMAKPSEAANLGDYLRAHRGATSVRAAAKRIKSLSRGDQKLSEGRWRQVEAGYESKGDLKIPVRPKAVTVAWMCIAVGADIATGLRLAGFDPNQHADLIRLGAATEPGDDGHADDIITRILEDTDLDAETKLEMIAAAHRSARWRPGSGARRAGS